MAAPMTGFPSSLSPWHLWGNTQQLSLVPNQFAAPELNFGTVTFLRASYARPETWRFMFSAIIKSAPTAGLGEQAQINIQFDLITGIGRSNMQIPGFVTFGYAWVATAAPVGTLEWTTLSRTTTLISATEVGFTDHFIGQDITFVAKANFVTDIPAAANAVIELSGQISPNVHVRPDWYQVDAEQQSVQFPGAEIGGR
jgi:hypothetical protein